MNARVRPTNPFAEFGKDEIEQSIPQRFEKMVQRYPERVAIKTRTDAWTYDSLNSAANGLAERILCEAPHGNEPVGILIERGAPVLIAVLAALKAGKIYLPLDPSYPTERLQFILNDAKPQLIITNKRNSTFCRAVTEDRCPIVNIDGIDTRVEIRNPGIVIAPQAFAYLLYTSGSTGQPKGVVESHRNVLHGTLRFTNGLHISADDRLLLTHSCSASASVRRIFPALLNGAALYPLDLKEEGIAALLDLLVQERITYFSTGRIRDFVRALGTHHAFEALRLVSFGGEIVHKTDVDLYRKIFPSDCLVGIWMSTTETGNITQYFIDSETQIAGDIAPIGYPAEDVEVFLVDGARRPVGRGDVGEIAVRSRYLSPGYWKRPDLTAARFIVDPQGSEERLYFTGDLGRMDVDGCLYHLGRKDDQIKIRGYRVEMAEIEAALLKVPGVRKGFVTAFGKDSQDKQLVAYVVPTGSPPTTSALRQAMAKYLPDYMIPSSFVFVDALPLTPTGKVDRKALTPPSRTRPLLDTAYVAPRSPVEKDLARLWAEILTVDCVGINDSFFELGGHSLSAVRLVTDVIKTFQIEVPLRTFFHSPTIASLAEFLSFQRGKRLKDDDLARILTDLQSLTDEDAQQLLLAASRLGTTS
jgi:amino acid adenylation domain-containing protein